MTTMDQIHRIRELYYELAPRKQRHTAKRVFKHLKDEQMVSTAVTDLSLYTSNRRKRNYG